MYCISIRPLLFGERLRRVLFTLFQPPVTVSHFSPICFTASSCQRSRAATCTSAVIKPAILLIFSKVAGLGRLALTSDAARHRTGLSNEGPRSSVGWTWHPRCISSSSTISNFLRGSLQEVAVLSQWSSFQSRQRVLPNAGFDATSR